MNKSMVSQQILSTVMTCVIVDKNTDHARLQNSRIFWERERRTIFERKAGASEKTARKNGERCGVWSSRASHSRITLTALPAFRKRLFCSLRPRLTTFDLFHATILKITKEIFVKICWQLKTPTAGLEKTPVRSSGTSRFSRLRASNFLSFLARRARTQTSRSLTKFLITILRRTGKL